MAADTLALLTREEAYTAVDSPVFVDTSVKTSHHKNVYLDEAWFEAAHGVELEKAGV